MGRAVLIAYYYPPLIGIASERAAAMTRHLPAFGWEAVVVTPREGFYHRAPELSAPPASVIRTPSIEVSRALRGVHGRVRPGGDDASGDELRAIEVKGPARAARRLVRELVYVPDAQVGWIPFATGAATRTLRGFDGPKVVFSTSVPYSAHFAAMATARASGVPWVAELRDPWSTGVAPGRTSSALRSWIDRTMEGRVLLRADHVVVTSESTRSQLLAAVPALRGDDISVVTNGFEPPPELPGPRPEEAMTMLYAGTVAPGEDTAPVLSALDHVHALHPGAFELHVVGPSLGWEPAGESRPWLRLDGLVSPERARELMASSSVLLLVQAHPAYATIIPGKAFEYIGARRPVVAAVARGTELEALLRRYADARFVDPGTPTEIIAAVERLLEEHRSGRLQEPRVPQSLIAGLERRAQTRRLAEIFERVAASEGGQRPLTGSTPVASC